MFIVIIRDLHKPDGRVVQIIFEFRSGQVARIINTRVRARPGSAPNVFELGLGRTKLPLGRTRKNSNISACADLCLVSILFVNAIKLIFKLQF
jgi:hypothetical protein